VSAPRASAPATAPAPAAAPAAEPAPVVFLLDVDNTLLDNDRITADLMQHLNRRVGAATRARYQALFEALRTELGYADYLGALQRYRAENLHDPRIPQVSAFLLEYPFAARLYPGAPEVLAHLRALGPTVILSTATSCSSRARSSAPGSGRGRGARAHLRAQERELDDVAAKYPARHYVLVDDKLRILDAVKRSGEGVVTTVFPRQGHYALDPAALARYPPADVAIEAIGDLAGSASHRLVP